MLMVNLGPRTIGDIYTGVGEITDRDVMDLQCMLDESVCHFRGVWSILLLYTVFDGNFCLQNNVEPDQMPHYVTSDLSLHCLPMTLLRIPGKIGLKCLSVTLVKHYSDCVCGINSL